MKDYINSVRFLGVDMVNNVNSGHPGVCLDAAPLVSELYVNNMKYSPKNPKWINRDYFVMSCGHASALFYSILHHAGFDIPLDEIKRFRQIDAITAGHPESTLTPGVDATTGPLGQGFGQAVGIALAEKMMARDFNEEGFPVIDHYTYVMCSDGDLQEGIWAESLSLAGSLKLGKLITFLDSNDIQLDGRVELSSVDDLKMKTEACGWHYILVNDGNDTQEIAKAIAEAKSVKDKPSFIEVKTILGEGTTMANTADTHGAPIGDEEREIAAKYFGHDQKPFEFKQEVLDEISKLQVDKEKSFDEWSKMMEEYKKAFPEKYAAFQEANQRTYELDVIGQFKDYKPEMEATRVSGGRILDWLSKNSRLPVGGSGDVKKSTGVKIYGDDYPKGNNLNYGVREFAMNTTCNGIAIHRGFIPFAGAYLPFSDYLKPALRVSALQGLPVIMMFTHDSIAVGEDGETHQPIEQITGLRTIPHVNVMRPADWNETMYTFHHAFNEKKRPTVIAMTRQGVDQVTSGSYEEFKQGAYIVKKESHSEPVFTVIATGSELALSLKAVEKLGRDDIRVVSMPSTQLFIELDDKKQKEIIPNKDKAIFIEASDGLYGYKFAKFVYAIEDSFGTCGKGPDVFERFGFTPDNIAKVIEEKIK